MRSVHRTEVASIYARKVWAKLSDSYRLKLYRYSIGCLVCGMDEQLDNVVDKAVVEAFVSDYADHIINKERIYANYGAIYFEYECFGLKKSYIENWLVRRRVNTNIAENVRGRIACECCRYEVFLPTDQMLYAWCPVCDWIADFLPNEDFSYMNRKLVQEGRENYRLYRTSDPKSPYGDKNPDAKYFRADSTRTFSWISNPQ